MKKHRNPSVLVALWGYTSVLGYCIKVIVILFPNCAVISDLVGEAMLILSFEAITTACLMFLFCKHTFCGDILQYFHYHNGIILQF